MTWSPGFHTAASRVRNGDHRPRGLHRQFGFARRGGAVRDGRRAVADGRRRRCPLGDVPAARLQRAAGCACACVHRGGDRKVVTMTETSTTAWWTNWSRRDRTVPRALPLGPAAGAPGQGREAVARDSQGIRGLRRLRGRDIERPRPPLLHNQRVLLVRGIWPSRREVSVGGGTVALEMAPGLKLAQLRRGAFRGPQL